MDTKVVGIKFKTSPKTYNFLAGDFEYKMGGGVIVETQRGIEYGYVSVLPRFLTEKEQHKCKGKENCKGGGCNKNKSPQEEKEENAEDEQRELKPVLRIATPEDDIARDKQEENKEENMRLANKLIRESGLEMKFLDCEYSFDGEKLIIHFSAENRVDFRDLVKKLAGAFKKRIELRQVGVRDEVKILGGIGSCGNVCCCKRYMDNIPKVGLKMAKNQGISPNPQKLAGLCGRLRCCLQFENETYSQINKKMPKKGTKVKTTDGFDGEVAGFHLLKESVKLKIQDKDKDSYSFKDYHLNDLLGKNIPVVQEEIETETDTFDEE
ncbi:MAG: stage 0 sporulation protein [Firmicutes bacterium]|nr:stage 0 sporulation protein [Bacillota bacterium]